MIRSLTALVVAVALIGAAPAAAPKTKLGPVPHNAQTATIEKYMQAMRAGKFGDAFALLNDDARAYYRNAENFRSIYVADGFALKKYVFLGTVGDEKSGRVYVARETASFIDHAHDAPGTITANVPIAVIATKSGWRIKDPGHPWRAFASNAVATTDDLRVTVKKVSFFARRIEIVATFANLGDSYVTLLPYGKSVLRDDAGTVYRIIETKDWSLTDKQLFGGLRLAPNAQYTGALTFESQPLDERPRRFTLTVAPMLRDGADAPFEVHIAGLAQ